MRKVFQLEKYIFRIYNLSGTPTLQYTLQMEPVVRDRPKRNTKTKNRSSPNNGITNVVKKLYI